MISAPRPLRRALLLSCALLAGAATTVSAQGAAASESGFVLFQSTLGSGGRSQSALMNTAQASVSQIGTGAEWSSENYVLRDGIVWGGAFVGSTSPIVTGTRVTGVKEGGESVQVFGFNFTSAGAGLPDVEFGGAFGTGAFASTNTIIDVTTPPGTDTFGNPVGAATVRVTNNLGSGRALEAFRYEPSLVQGTYAQPGKSLELHLFTKPNSFPLFTFGKSISGFGINVAPFDGQLVLPLNFQLLSTSLTPALNGFARQSVPVPDDAGLVGAPLEFQALSLDDLTLQAGAWSNLLPVTIVP